MLDTTEASLMTRIGQLESQLERSRDTVSSQETQLAKLRASIDETLAAQRRSMQEKDQLEQEVHNLKNKIWVCL